MPLRLGTIFDFSWDFTLYSEGFMSILADSNPERLITVEELATRDTLDPAYLSVQAYCDLPGEAPVVPEGKYPPSPSRTGWRKTGWPPCGCWNPSPGRTFPRAFPWNWPRPRPGRT
jgi:hypothetical protein